MAVSIKSNPDGLTGAIQVNGVDAISFDIDGFTQGGVSPDGTQVLTNKTISVDNNTVSGVAASSFVVSDASGNIDSVAQKAIPTGAVVGTTDTQTLTNKTIQNPILTLNNTQGTEGQVAISQGAGLPPVWEATKTINNNSILGTGNIQVSLPSDIFYTNLFY